MTWTGPKASAFDRDGVLGPGTRFFDPSAEGKAAREILFRRFKGYRQKASVDLSVTWINDAAGAFAESMDVRGIKVGVVGVNTAWLSKDEKDKAENGENGDRGKRGKTGTDHVF